jgi:hypothetical protein
MKIEALTRDTIRKDAGKRLGSVPYGWGIECIHESCSLTPASGKLIYGNVKRVKLRLRVAFRKTVMKDDIENYFFRSICKILKIWRNDATRRQRK